MSPEEAQKVTKAAECNRTLEEGLLIGSRAEGKRLAGTAVPQPRHYVGVVVIIGFFGDWVIVGLCNEYN